MAMPAFMEFGAAAEMRICCRKNDEHDECRRAAAPDRKWCEYHLAESLRGQRRFRAKRRGYDAEQTEEYVNRAPRAMVRGIE